MQNDKFFTQGIQFRGKQIFLRSKSSCKKKEVKVVKKNKQKEVNDAHSAYICKYQGKESLRNMYVWHFFLY